MVSTTLTTLAAGQSSMTSSANLHHQQEQQQSQSTPTETTAASTANNCNYQRSTSQAITAQRYNNNHYYNSLTLNGIGSNNNNNNNNNNGKSNNSSNSENEYNRNQQQLETYSALYNGKTSNGANLISSATTSTAIDETAKYETSAQYGNFKSTGTTTTTTATASATTPTTTLVNLSEGIICSSPPIDDQISLLFPKCRPKQTTTSASAILTAATTNTPEHCFQTTSNDNELTTDGNLLLINEDIDSEPVNKSARRTTTTTSTINTNYYKNVNIITQSPPPPSTSSVSSESLSSVTPRISTNPFLSGLSNNADEEHYTQRVKERAAAEEEPELPIPLYNSYYYPLTSQADISPTTASMPRKRVAYNPGFAATPTEDTHCSPSNPFLKDSYWDTVPTNSNGLESNTAEPENVVRAAATSNARRLHSQQNYSNSNGNNNSNTIANYLGRSAQQVVPHHARRLGPSPVHRYAEQRKYDVLPPAKRSYHHSQHYAHHAHKSAAYADGITAVPTGRYIYGSKNSLERYGNASIDCWEKREKTISREYERERERKMYAERDRERDRLRERDWEEERDPARIRDWERDNLRNWEHERDFERRREHERERHYERERERLRYREKDEVQDRDRKREQDLRDIYEIGQQQQLEQQEQERQQKSQQANYSMISNGEVVVFDDIAESWQNLRVTTDHVTSKTSPTTTANIITQRTSKDEQRDYDDEMLLKELKRSTEKTYTMSLETRHGIIEYEGSPRRIGHSGNAALDESLSHTNNNNSRIQDVKSAKSNPQYNMEQSTPNSPPQYPARPGFPQRIISPPRDCTPPILLAACKSTTNQPMQQQQQIKQQQQQQISQSLLQQSSTDNNAEDTSNDVSEIGTISDLNTPEAISATVVVSSAAAVTMSSTEPLPSLDSIYTPSTSNASTAEGNNTITNSAVAATTTTATTMSAAISIAKLPTTTTATTAASSVAGTTTTTTTTTGSSSVLSIPTKSSTFDYLYEFSETRKVLEEFFKCPSNDEKALENGSDVDSIDIQYEFHTGNIDINGVHVSNHVEPSEEEVEALELHDNDNNAQIKENHTYKRNSHPTQQKTQYQQQFGGKHLGKHQRRHFTGSPLMRSFDFFLDSASRSSAEQLDIQDVVNHNPQMDATPNYRYSPETTDYDSNCGDLDSLSGDINGISNNCSNYNKYYETKAAKHEDALSSGHSTDSENNNPNDANNHLPQKTALNTVHRTPPRGGISMLMDAKRVSASNNNSNMHQNSEADIEEINKRNSMSTHAKLESSMSSYIRMNDSPYKESLENNAAQTMHRARRESHELHADTREAREHDLVAATTSLNNSGNKVFKNIDPELDSLYSISVFHRPDMVQMTPPPPAPAPHRKPNVLSPDKEILQPTPYIELRSATSNTTATNLSNTSVASAISSTLNRCKITASATAASRSAYPPPIPERNIVRTPSPVLNSPVWLPRHMDYSASKNLLESNAENPSKHLSADEEDIDTDLETDRLLGHQRLDDQGYYDENKSWDTRKARSSLLSKISPKQHPSTKTRNGYNALLSSTPEIPPPIPPKHAASKIRERGCSASSSEHSIDKSPQKGSNHLDVRDDCLVATVNSPGGGSIGSGCISAAGNGIGGGTGSTGSNGINYKKDTDLLESNNNSQNGSGGGSVSGHGGGSLGSQTTNTSGEKKVKKSKNKEGGAVLIEGVLFRAKYLGSTQLVCEGQPTKSTRMMQAEEAVSRIKAPDGDVQPSTEVDLFISTEKIMVLNTDLKEIMMDHALRTISYIADIGDLVVLMARRRFVPQDIDDAPKPNRTPKMICHVFESDEAQFIAQSIGQAFQVAYMEFLKANGIEDHSFVKEMDYQEVLNSQEIFGDELEIFAKKELQKEVVVPKAKGEILGVVIVESGWGSMLPTVVIANLMSSGAAARCGQLNIGDQLIAINGLSLVGLPLSTCQSYIKNTKNQTVVKFTVVPCAPVVEVKIKRPNTKYQLGFSVQNGVICSLLRGGIAERGGVRVGHRIIEINNQSVVAVPHEKIVNLLATSVGEILMKTMPTSMFRLLTGQENPIYI